MQVMTNRHTKELDIFYKEHRNQCTKCGYNFKDGDCVHVGYIPQRQYAVLCDNCSSLLSETVVRYSWMQQEYDEPMKEDKLWRYMDLSKFISLISREELYFSAASSFEDVFEGAKGLARKKDEWDDFYLSFFQEAIKSAPISDKAKSEMDIHAEAKRLLENMNIHGMEDRNTTFITCWHNNEYESEAMWKIYSHDITNAVAVQTTAGHLYEALNKNPHISIGKVKYIDFDKRFSSVNGAFWYKRKSFEYENEVRAILRMPGIKERGIYIPVNIRMLIDKVYVSPYASQWFFDVVKDVLQKYNLDIDILYSQMNETPFF